MDHHRLTRAEEFLRAKMAEQHIPAAALTIVERGQMLTAEAYGTADLEWNVAATPETVFQLASATKLLTATLVMLLVEADEIRLDDSVANYLPEAPPSWKPITIRQIASHTSGIPDQIGVVTSVEGTVEAAVRTPLEYDPGSQVKYGLNDYVVLTDILQRLTGKSFQALLQERLLGPLGMTSTRFDNNREEGPYRIWDVVPRRASIYRWTDGRQMAYAFLYPTWTQSAGGIYSSAVDLATWAEAIDRGQLLRPESLTEMWTRAKLTSGEESPFGIGWIVDKHDGLRATGHSGGPALADIVRFVDSALTIAVLTNQQNLRPDLAMGVADVLLGAG
jgi:CubicO group peptidase (beta-lactamase class C family)